MPFWQTSPSLHHREHLTVAAPARRTLLCFQGSGSALKRCPNPPPAAALQHPRGGQLRAGCGRSAVRGSSGCARGCAGVGVEDGERPGWERIALHQLCLLRVWKFASDVLSLLLRFIVFSYRFASCFF